MDDEISFGRWVKARRVALGLTQAILAERTGYSIVTIRKLESDLLRPSQQNADRLADALAVAAAERTDFIRWARREANAPSQRSHILAPPAPIPAPLTHPILTSFLSEESAPVARQLPFVGRARELAELEATLETSLNGRGQILFVIGDAGRGKTTLVQEFARRAQHEHEILLVTGGHCNAHTGIGDPYLPFRIMLSALAGDVEAKLSSGLLSTESARRLWEAMPVTLPALVEHAPDLIGPFIPAKALQSHAAHFAQRDARWVQRLEKLTEDEPRMQLDEKRLFAQVTAALKAMAARRPLLLILEDLHWVDTASSSLLFHLSREISLSPILIVGTYRPDELVGPRKEGQREERHPLLNITKELKRQHGDIWLDLGEQSVVEGRDFVDAYLDTQPNRLGEAFRAAFFHHTGGHALFTVELLREMQARADVCKDEEGIWREGDVVDWRTLPPKVEGVIEKRIERLEEALQEILTLASVEGEIFTAEVVARVLATAERELVQRLSNELDRQHRMVTAEELNHVGFQRLSRYRFRHYMFQHYLYHRLDAMERAYLHEAIGNVLERLYGSETEPVAVQLAYHYEQAGVTEKAVTYLRQAGEGAQRLSAHHEAYQHLTQALRLVAGLPNTLQRTRQELALQIALGNTLLSMKGTAVVETGEAYQRAYDLALQTGDTPQLFAALHGLHAYHNTSGESQRARAEAAELLHLAQNQPDPILRVSAHNALGVTLMFIGEFASAREHFEQCVFNYQPQNHLAHLLLSGQDEGVTCRARLAFVLYVLGYPDQAMQRGHEAVTLAQRLAHPMTVLMSFVYNTVMYLLLHDGRRAQQYAEATISLAAEQGFAFRLAVATHLRGLAMVGQGNAAGIEQMNLGLKGIQGTNDQHNMSYYLAGLSEGYALAGQSEQGLNLLADALAVAHKTDDRFWEAEIYRLKGELLIMHDNGKDRATTAQITEVESCFRQAIDIARRQQAKSLELRATTSLCRLWQAQGKSAEAYPLLAEIYDWFTEGFDTADLIEAKALLYALH